MAIITSAATGNFSNPATWVGGVVPGPLDNARANTGHNVTIDVDTTVINIQAVSTGRFIMGEGVVYGDGTFEGNLIVPSPSNVRKGVPTDNTVGTADLSAQDFLDLLSTSPDPIAERLRNVATVQTTGDQITSLS